jgi:hypothetical protein
MSSYKKNGNIIGRIFDIICIIITFIIGTFFILVSLVLLFYILYAIALDLNLFNMLYDFVISSG